MPFLDAQCAIGESGFQKNAFMQESLDRKKDLCCSMALYSPAYFEELFAPLTGKRIGYFPLNGNVGDYLGRQATRGLFDYFEIEFEEVRSWMLDPGGQLPEIEHLVISGGGNMGSSLYRVPFKERRVALRIGLPVTLFPQTFVDNEEDVSGYERVFVREKRSLSLNSRFKLAPDMAMGHGNVPPLDKPAERVGMFLRRDMEARFDDHPRSLGDPADLCATSEEYLELAGRFRHIVTDRLHFAIAALLQNRAATLLPNSYWKNRAVFDTWLHDFDCRWMDDPSEISFDRAAVVDRMLHRLAAAPSEAVAWSCRPVTQPGYHIYEHDGVPVIQRPDGRTAVRGNESTRVVWALCDGSQTVSEILEDLLELYPRDSLAVARDLQHALKFLHDKQAVRFIPPVTESETPAPAPASTIRSKRAGGSMEIVIEPARRDGDWVVRSASVNEDDNSRPLWFRYHEHQDYLTHDNADPFLLAALMRGMRTGRDIVIRNAPVSTLLLGRLERFQQVWSSWRSELEHVQIDVESDTDSPPDAPPAALLAFSGGVDSCFAAWEYGRAEGLRHQNPVTAGLMIHGFDIHCTPELEPVFERAAEGSREILEDASLPLLTVKTNARSLCNRDWLDYHGLMLGAALNLFKGGFRTGLIPSTMPYDVVMPLGSNPISDPLMSCLGFDIVHYGSHASRMQKLSVVGRWEAAARRLRVCWQGPRLDRNCGYCSKCVLTHLGMWAHGLDAPCFDVPLSADLVGKALGDGPLALLDWMDVHCILTEALGRGLDAPWVSVLRYKLSIRQ